MNRVGLGAFGLLLLAGTPAAAAEPKYDLLLKGGHGIDAKNSLSAVRGGAYEQDLADMAAAPTAEMAKKYPGLIIGVKTAHYAGPEWTPVEHAVEAGTLANIPVMVDFGANKAERPLAELVTKKLRPGDIYTHCYSGLRGELDPAGHVNAGMVEGRKRG